MEVKIGNTLSRLMKEKHLTVRELSKMSGVSQSTLHEWTNNRSPRDPVQVRKVADALGVSLNFLLFGEEDRNQQFNITQIFKEDVFSGVFEIQIKRVREKK